MYGPMSPTSDSRKAPEARRRAAAPRRVIGSPPAFMWAMEGPRDCTLKPAALSTLNHDSPDGSSASKLGSASSGMPAFFAVSSASAVRTWAFVGFVGGIGARCGEGKPTAGGPH
jgi:hypothetical protein